MTRLLCATFMDKRFGFSLTFLAAVFGLVYALPALVPPLKAEKTVTEKAEPEKKTVEILRDNKILPEAVARIRQEILKAAASGDIEALRIPIEMNEIPPIFAAEKLSDPIAYLKKQSGDGEGREILAALIELLRTGFVRQNGGTGDEMYVWPYFAEMPLASLTPGQEVELLTLITPERLKAMKQAGKYDHYRLGIAHDGTWHFFRKDGQD